MFGRKEKKPSQAAKQKEPFTYIHKGTLLEGDLSVKGRVRIHGTVRGNLRVAGVLEVAEGGLIEGQIVQVEEAVIIGTVRANLEAKGKIEIWKKGVLEGDVRAAALDIEEGALFSGRSDMRPAGVAKEAPIAQAGTQPSASLKAADKAQSASSRLAPRAKPENTREQSVETTQ